MFKKIVLYFSILLFSFSISAKNSIKIGSKKFSESFILAEIIAIIIEKNYNTPVIRKLGLGGTQIAFEALETGSIDIYPEYTGTGYTMLLKQTKKRSPEEIFKYVSKSFIEKWNLVWSPSLGFNNTYAIVVRNDDPRFKEISKMSDLSKNVFEFKYASPHEFMERLDGHRKMVEAYELNFDDKKIIGMDAGLTYSSIRDKQVDMIMAYSTDGRIKGFNLKKLKDDQNFFPSYVASYIARKDIINRFPFIRYIFKDLHNTISEDDILELNDQVDRLKRSEHIVAHNYLIKKGIIKGDIIKFTKDEGLLKFFYLKRFYLGKLIQQHLILSILSLSLAFFIAIPLGVLLTRYGFLEKLIFPIINTMQTIPSLALLGFLVPILGIGFWPAIMALFFYSLLPLVRNTFIGIKSVDKSLVEASRGVGLTNFQILRMVEIPLALPVILTGLRTAAVIVIGTATLAAMIGAGGLGEPILRGVSTVNNHLILLGAIPSALLAILVDKFIGKLDTILVSKGIHLENKR